jgi:hypothetical protein
MTLRAALADPDCKRVAVFAHPDDETLWAGGLLASYPGPWQLIACSVPVRDPIRAQRFYSAARSLGGIGIVMPYREQGQTVPLDLSFLPDLSSYGVIVTHGAAGEYGHEHHKQLHDHLFASYPGHLICSAYGSRGSDFTIELDAKLWAHKLSALHFYNDEMDWHGKPTPTFAALLELYGGMFDLSREPFVEC